MRVARQVVLNSSELLPSAVTQKFEKRQLQKAPIESPLIPPDVAGWISPIAFGIEIVFFGHTTLSCWTPECQMTEPAATTCRELSSQASARAICRMIQAALKSE